LTAVLLIVERKKITSELLKMAAAPMLREINFQSRELRGRGERGKMSSHHLPIRIGGGFRRKSQTDFASSVGFT
jgi:hypothetical protein